MEKHLKQRWTELPYLFKIQLWSYLIAGICGAIAYPLTTQMIYSNVEVDILSERLVLSSLIGLALSWLWLTIQEKMYRYFVWFTVAEFFMYVFLISYVIIWQDYNNYLIWATIIGASIGHIVSGGGQKLHQKITDVEQYRTDYNFFIEIISSLGVLVGSATAVSIPFSITTAFLLLLVSIIFFQMTDIYVYYRVKKRDEGKKDNTADDNTGQKEERTA